jgi:hypothetical protein
MAVASIDRFSGLSSNAPLEPMRFLPPAGPGRPEHQLPVDAQVAAWGRTVHIRIDPDGKWLASNEWN